MALGILVFFAVGLICRAYGGQVLRVTGEQGWLAGTALGSAALIFSWFLLGCAGLLHPVGEVSILLAMAALAGPAWKSTASELILFFRDRRYRVPWSGEGFLFWSCLGIFALSFFRALAPQTGMDVGAYHYPLAKVFLQEEGWVVRPDIRSNLAGGWHILYAGLMGLGGETSANLCGFGATLLAAGAIHAISKKFSDSTTARLAVFLFLTTPIVSTLSSSAFLEMPTIAFMAVSFYLLMEGDEKAPISFLLCSVLLSVLVVSGKLSASYAVLIALVALLRGTRFHGIRFFVIAGILGFVGLLFWQLHQLYLGAGNPQEPAQIVEKIPRPHDWESWKSFLKKMGHHTFLVGATWGEALGGLFLLLVAGMGIFGVPKGKGRLCLFFLIGSYILFVLMMIVVGFEFLAHYAVLRYVAPAFLVFGIPLAAWVASQAWTRSSSSRVIVIAAIVFCAVPVFVLMAGRSAAVGKVVLGWKSRDLFLSERIESYPASKWLNEKGGKDSFVVSGVVRPYYLDLPYRNFGPGGIVLQLEELLQTYRPRYVLYETGYGYAEDAVDHSPGRERLKLMFRARGCRVYEVLSEN